MEISRCNSVLEKGNKQPVTLARSTSSIEGNMDRAGYVQKNIVDAEANLQQFLQQYVQDQLPPGLDFNAAEVGDINQCQELSSLFDQNVSIRQNIQTTVSTLMRMESSLPYTTTKNTDDMQTLLNSAVQDLKNTVNLVGSANVQNGVRYKTDLPKYSTVKTYSSFSGKDIIARAYLIDKFLRDLSTTNTLNRFSH